MKRPLPRAGSLTLAALALALAALAACAINPATGESQLTLFTEAEEIALGAEVDRELVMNSGVYDDPELAAYVAWVGRRLAAVSERPELPWSFRIADDEVANAFALPGGRIYVTRGLLAHLNREAELAGVLGHEIGHVTARHTVHALSRDLAVTLGLVAGLELFDAGETSELVSLLGLEILFLKFGRNQERQADQLGVRYARRAGFDPHGVLDALAVLRAVSRAEGDGWFPVWLSTHPDPERRGPRLAEEAGLGPGRPAAELAPEIDAYVARLDGLVVGPDPRNGVLENNAFVQHRHGFQVTFPRGWAIEREGQTLAAENPAGDALVMLLPQVADTVEEAAAAFAAEEGIEVEAAGSETLGGLPARVVRFGADLEGEAVRGLAAFARTPDRVIAVVGLSAAASWPERGPELQRAVRSVRRLDGSRGRAAAPDRLRIVTLDRPMDASEIARRYAPGVEPSSIALLNQLPTGLSLPAGRKVKVVAKGG